MIMDSFVEILTPFLMTFMTALFGAITVRINKKQKTMEDSLSKQSALRRKERAVNKEIAGKIKVKDEIIEQLIVVNSQLILNIAENTSSSNKTEINQAEINKLADRYKDVMSEINILLIKRDTIDAIYDGTHSSNSIENKK